MKKFFYLVTLLLLSLSFVVSCNSSTKEDEPEVPETPPPAPTTADSLQGTWVSYAAQIAGTTPVSGPYSFTTTNLIVLTYDTLNFSGTNVKHTWAPLSPNGNWPHRLATGTFSVSNGILSNPITKMRTWLTMPPSSLTVDSIENHTYKMYFATNLPHTPYSKDTLTLVMSGSTMITNNKYNPAMGIFTNTAAGNAPFMILKFKRIP